MWEEYWASKSDDELFKKGFVTPTLIVMEMLRFIKNPDLADKESARIKEVNKRRAERKDIPLSAEEREINDRFEKGYYDGGPGGPSHNKDIW